MYQWNLYLCWDEEVKGQKCQACLNVKGMCLHPECFVEPSGEPIALVLHPEPISDDEKDDAFHLEDES